MWTSQFGGRRAPVPARREGKRFAGPRRRASSPPGVHRRYGLPRSLRCVQAEGRGIARPGPLRPIENAPRQPSRPGHEPGALSPLLFLQDAAPAGPFASLNTDLNLFGQCVKKVSIPFKKGGCPRTGGQYGGPRLTSCAASCRPYACPPPAWSCTSPSGRASRTGPLPRGRRSR